MVPAKDAAWNNVNSAAAQTQNWARENETHMLKMMLNAYLHQCSRKVSSCNHHPAIVH